MKRIFLLALLVFSFSTIRACPEDSPDVSKAINIDEVKSLDVLVLNVDFDNQYIMTAEVSDVKITLLTKRKEKLERLFKEADLAFNKSYSKELQEFTRQDKEKPPFLKSTDYHIYKNLLVCSAGGLTRTWNI